MCVIIYKPNDETFTRDKFDQCWLRNSHGVGFAAINGELTYKKGLMVRDDAWKEIEPFTGPGYELIIHFRIQSRGGISPNLTHPFDYSNTESTRLLFHNGTVKPLHTTGQASDTEELGKLLKRFSDKDADILLKYLTEKKYGRFVTVIYPNSGDDPIINIYQPPESTTIDEKSARQVEGIWYSNTIHLNHKPGKSSAVGDDFCDSRSQNYNAADQLLTKIDKCRALLKNPAFFDEVYQDAGLEGVDSYIINQACDTEHKLFKHVILKA